MALQTAQMTINLHENDSRYASRELSRQLRPVGFVCTLKLHFPKHHHYRPNTNLTNSVAFSPQANYTDRATAACGEVSANYCG
jgi:hypothetical protein